jgi:hypothetical protein
MNRKFPPILFLALVLTARGEEMNKPKLDLYPDTVILNDGTTLRGLIVRNDAQILTLQQRIGEKEISKTSIRRIIDDNHESAYFADIMDPGKLPPWRMIVQDFRCDDNVRSFRQIPATSIDEGYLRFIPYLSFRINERLEMNIYGNPENPVCLEFGVYEHSPANITKFKKIIRAYLAGVLRSRDEIAALYSLPESGGEKRVGDITFKVLPPTAPDAFGGWWISIFKSKSLAAARIPADEYAKVTVPFHEVNTAAGKLRTDRLRQNEAFLATTPWKFSSVMPDLQGFYRDGMGQLKLLIPSFMKKSPSVQ